MVDGFLQICISRAAIEEVRDNNPDTGKDYYVLKGPTI